MQSEVNAEGWNVERDEGAAPEKGGRRVVGHWKKGESQCGFCLFIYYLFILAFVRQGFSVTLVPVL